MILSTMGLIQFENTIILNELFKINFLMHFNK